MKKEFTGMSCTGRSCYDFIQDVRNPNVKGPQGIVVALNALNFKLFK